MGNLSYNNIPKNEIVSILTFVTDNFIKILQTEIHEKVLCHSLEMFSLWAVNYTNELPQKIIDTFLKGLELKSATQSVRVAYLQWLLACLEQATLPSNDLSTALIKTVEKASQSAAQIPLVSEAVCAACVILKTEKACDDKASKLNSFWNIVLDMSKQVF